METKKNVYKLTLFLQQNKKKKKNKKMNATNTVAVPDTINPSETSYAATNVDPITAAEHGKRTQSPPPGHTTGGNHVMQDIKNTLHDIKENVKETFHRDHRHGQDCEKRPQDGKTNPME